MYSNYFKTAWRNLLKHPFYSFINMVGLGLGLIAVFFIFLYVKDELSYDRYHKNIDQLYRLNFIAKLGDQEANTSAVPCPAGPLFSEIFPEAKSSCRIYTGHGDYTVSYDEHAFRETSVASVDSTFGDLFSVHVLEGNIKNTLSQSGKIVINVSEAKKYFGYKTGISLESPIGKSLLLENSNLYQVGAIIEDLPKNSHFQFDMLLPMLDQKDSYDADWGSTNYHTYFLLKDGVAVNDLSAKMNQVFVEKFTLEVKRYLNMSWDEFIKQGNFARVQLFPVQKIHLYSHFDEEFMPAGSIAQVYAFSIIGLVILFLACINFINLSTARATLRAREVGVRKAIGAMKSALAAQFLSESLLLSLLAAFIGLGLMWIVMPLFNQMSGKSFSFGMILQPSIWLPFLFITMITGLLAGIYPALYLSGLQPVKVLKGLVLRSQKSLIRGGLVVFQFLISIVLVIGSITIYQQLKFMQNKKLGFNKDQVLIINNFYLIGKNATAFKDQLAELPDILSSGVSNFLPASTDRNTSAIIAGRVATADNSILSNNWSADRDFIHTMEFDIVAGRSFDKSIRSDSLGVVINEALAKSFGHPKVDVIGKILGRPGDEGRITEYHILGVMKDFNFMSLQHRIEPLAIYNGGGLQYISIRIGTRDVASTILKIGKLWASLAPGIPFEYNFMDERYNQLYRSEQRIGTVSLIFSVFAIFIACIGLLGLATFTIQQRIKEIGIRKVLGASTQSIIGLMSTDFLWILGLAICFAFPLSWYLIHRWLMGFEYRMDINVWLFIGTGIVIMLSAMIIVFVQSFRAALLNPVRSLRAE
ncbi:MAG: ABC transporter permease [Saprospiraceae bacterium]|nr:ABC transporter permease [Saprospiraceae bacterium]